MPEPEATAANMKTCTQFCEARLAAASVDQWDNADLTTYITLEERKLARNQLEVANEHW